jgi:hypothetical protein
MRNFVICTPLILLWQLDARSKKDIQNFGEKLWKIRIEII